MMLLNDKNNDMYEEGIYQGPDPLAAARQHLDFAAMAAAAPSVKQVLFKAQTMGPLPKTRPSTKTLGGIGAGVLALALLAVPWMPQNSSLLVLRVGFERNFTRKEAAKVYNSILNNAPAQTLLDASFTVDSVNGKKTQLDGEDGHLYFTATSFNTSRTNLEDKLRKLAIAAVPDGAEPMFSQLEGLQSTSFGSPLQLALKQLQPQADIELGAQPADSPAASVAQHAELIGRGLQQRLDIVHKGIQVSNCRFIDARGATAEQPASELRLPTWPAELALNVKPYHDLTEGEQAEIRSLATEYVRGLGLSKSDDPDGGQALFVAADAWQPVVVSVWDQQGNYDRYLTQRLQAAIKQPTIEGLKLNPYDVEKKLYGPLHSLLPHYKKRVIFGEEYSWIDGVRVHIYNVRVEIDGPGEDNAAPRKDPTNDPAVGEDIGSDW